MKVNVVMPKMGESLQEGTITKWLKNEGDIVERDEMILEISTDKVDTEVPSPVAGKLTRILAKENETIEVGHIIAEIETEGSSEEAAAPVEENAGQQAPKAPAGETTEEAPAAAAPAESQPGQAALTQTESEPVQEPSEPVAQEIRPVAKPAGAGMVEVVMPKMGESLQEGTITKWMKKAGDKIERDEMILEISTDKVDTEVPSPVSGILAEILVQENQTVEVGSAIARISTGESAAPVETTAPAAQPEAKKAEAPAETPQAQPAQPEEETEGEDTGAIPRESGKQFFSPVVRNIAESEGISLRELQTIKGSGIEGRVTKQDVTAYLENRKKAPVEKAPVQEAKPAVQKAEAKPAAAEVKPKAESKPVPAPPSAGPDDEIVPMDRVRQLISEHMAYSWQTSPHVTSVAEADITNIVKFRDKHKADFEKREGLKLTFMPFMAKAAVDAIKQFPQINVSVDGKNIINHKRINLGIATALEGFSLIVPVIKNADSLSISGLARSITDLSTRARTKKLNPDDIQGGTFTITNFGAFNTLFGTPIINQPQVAIMGVGTIGKRPVVREIDGENLIVIRDMVYISLTFDHRVVDGMLAGYVLNAIVKGLEAMNESTLL